MKVLAFDTAMGALSAAIWSDGEIISARHEILSRGHAEKLMPMIAEVCGDAALDVADCDRIGVTIGPGTFTGQRVGLAAARAMRLGTDLSIAGLTTLKALAAGVDDAEAGSVIVSLIDARRGEVYMQLFSAALDDLSAPCVVTPVAAANHLQSVNGSLILVGTGAKLVSPILNENQTAFKLSSAAAQPDASHVARLAATVEEAELHIPSPLYLRAPDAKLPEPK